MFDLVFVVFYVEIVIFIFVCNLIVGLVCAWMVKGSIRMTLILEYFTQ